MLDKIVRVAVAYYTPADEDPARAVETMHETIVRLRGLLDAALAASREEVERLKAERDEARRIFAWMLGEEGDFPSAPDELHEVLEAGRAKAHESGVRFRRPRLYWWRTELRARLSSLPAASPSASAAGPQHVCGLQGFGRGVGALIDRCPVCEAAVVSDLHREIL